MKSPKGMAPDMVNDLVSDLKQVSDTLHAKLHGTSHTCQDEAHRNRFLLLQATMKVTAGRDHSLDRWRIRAQPLWRFGSTLNLEKAIKAMIHITHRYLMSCPSYKQHHSPPLNPSQKLPVHSTPYPAHSTPFPPPPCENKNTWKLNLAKSDLEIHSYQNLGIS